MNIDRMFLVITNSCSASCHLCSYPQQNPKRFLSLSFIRQQVLPWVIQQGIGFVIITGGEPTLHPELGEIIQELKKANVRVTVITNGIGLANGFEKLVSSVNGYIFSVDGGNAELYYKIRGLSHFNELIQWPAKIKKQNPHTQIAFSCLLQKLNVKHLNELYRLTAELPVDALFFNVPELKPHCFGRHNETPQHSLEQVLLDDEEMAALQDELHRVWNLDQKRGLLHQGYDFLENAIAYFQSFRKPQRRQFNSPEVVCQVPFCSVVIDEAQMLHPCFYLPGALPFINAVSNNPLVQDEYQYLLNEMANNRVFRQEHCSFCLQFQI